MGKNTKMSGKEFLDNIKEETERFNKELAEKLEKPKPFPYYPLVVSEDEMKRMEVMMELNKWAYNDKDIAQRSAQTLILLLSKQFGIEVSISIKETKQ